MSGFLHKENAAMDKQVPAPHSLPLVSVIIVNYNYGSYLKQAIDSVFQQTYPNIECILVDNASTDGSSGIIAAASKQYPGLKILRRSDNCGQSLASKEGFEMSSGEYVVFLDADDVLLSSCIETHIFVHLSLRVPAGFTSADMIQSVDSRMVLGTIPGLSAYVRKGAGRKRDLLRRIDAIAPELWSLSGANAGIENQVHLIEPAECDFKAWHWAPTSGNCFRREALQLFLNNGRLAELRSCTDAYVLRGIGILMGSVLIDRPLAIYRLHGMNVFSKHPHLYGILNYERGGPADNDLLGRKLVIGHLIDSAKLFLRKLESPQQYMLALERLDSAWPRIPAEVKGCRSYAAAKLVANARIVANELGFFNFVLLLTRLKAPPYAILRAVLSAKAGRRGGGR